MREAADEIERLRASLAKLTEAARAVAFTFEDEDESVPRDFARLSAVLAEIEEKP